VQQAAAGLSISVPAANAALNNLFAAGIVSLVNERQWGRVFQATQLPLVLPSRNGRAVIPSTLERADPSTERCARAGSCKR